MATAYDIVLYQPRYQEQVVQLQTGLWSPDVAINAAYLEWKYQDCPYQQPPLIYLALQGGEVVGMRGIHGARWCAGEDAIPEDVGCAGDMVVVPAHQNRGLFRQINDAAMRDLAVRGYRFVFNFSAAPVTFLRSLRAGWRLAGGYRTVARPPGALAAAHTDRLRRVEQMIADESDARPAEMADLNRRLDRDDGLGASHRIRHVCEEAYIAWRYANPLSSYVFLYAGGAELDGYIVLQQSRGAQSGRINILEWVALRPETLMDLLVVAIARIQPRVIATWSATLSEPQLECLAATSFRHFDEGQGVNHYQPGILVREVGGAAAGHTWVLQGTPLLDISRWDLRMAYSDGF